MESAGRQHADSLKRVAGTEHDHSGTCHLTVTPSYQQRCTVSTTLIPNNPPSPMRQLQFLSEVSLNPV